MDDPLAETRYRCLYCDYDLRGHEGDPRLCPECGSRSALEDMIAAAELTDEDIDKYESAPTIAILMFWLLTLSLVLLLYGMWIAALVIAGPAGFVWLWSVRRFAKKFRNRPGCWETLGWFHLSGTLLVIACGAFGFAAEAVEDLARRFGVNRVGLATLTAIAVLHKPVRRAVERVSHPYKIAKRKLRRLATLTALGQKRRQER